MGKKPGQADRHRRKEKAKARAKARKDKAARKAQKDEPIVEYGRPAPVMDLGWLPDDFNEADGKTPSERFVTRLSRRAFLALWTYPNPVGKGGKELCDCLIVCGPHVVIVSVKEVEYKDTGDPTGYERWRRDAIEKSVKQIRGAERFLERASTVTTASGRVVELPPLAERKYHRLSVSLGGRGEVPALYVEEEGKKGTVHLCDEHSVGVLFWLLNTITDFTDFLEAVESFEGGIIMVNGGIEDLVAMYIKGGRTFGLPDVSTPSVLMVHGGICQKFLRSPEYVAWQRRLAPARYWTRALERWVDDALSEHGLTEIAKLGETREFPALALMAMEPMEERAFLGQALIDFLNRDTHSRARVMSPRPGLAYVLLAGSSEDAEHRGRELVLRCHVVRGRLPGITTVVGISMDRPGQSTIGYREEIVYLHYPEWPEEREALVKGVIDELGYFRLTDWSKIARLEPSTT